MNTVKQAWGDSLPQCLTALFPLQSLRFLLMKNRCINARPELRSSLASVGSPF